MVICAMVNCPHRTDKYRYDHKNGVRFFSIPKVITTQCDLTRRRSERRRSLWLSKINMKDLQDANVKAHTKVCSAHFIKGMHLLSLSTYSLRNAVPEDRSRLGHAYNLCVSGAPSALWDENNPDWAPSQNLGYSWSTSPCVSSAARHDRTKRRAAKRDVPKPSIDCSDLPIRNEEPAVVAEDQENPTALDGEVVQDGNEPGCENSVKNTGSSIETRSPSVNVDPQETLLQLQELQTKHHFICMEYAKIVRVSCALVNMCPSIVVHPDIQEEMDESTQEMGQDS